VGRPDTAGPCCAENGRHESRESSPASGDGRLRQERVIRSRGSVPGYDPEAQTESAAVAPRASSALRGAAARATERKHRAAPPDAVATAQSHGQEHSCRPKARLLRSGEGSGRGAPLRPAVDYRDGRHRQSAARASALSQCARSTSAAAPRPDGSGVLVGQRLGPRGPLGARLRPSLDRVPESHRAARLTLVRLSTTSSGSSSRAYGCSSATRSLHCCASSS